MQANLIEAVRRNWFNFANKMLVVFTYIVNIGGKMGHDSCGPALC